MYLKGTSGVLGSLRRLDQAGTEAVRATVKYLVEETAEVARNSMDGAGVSLPGEPPTTKSGELEASVKHQVRKIKNGVRGVVGTSELKGYFLEFGHSSMAARPWLHPAFERVTAGAEQELKSRMRVLL